MTPSLEPDDSDIFARLAQAESRLARLESIQARQPLVPGGYVNEIGEQFKKTIDDLLTRRIDRFGDRLEARIDRFGDSLSQSFAGSSGKLSDSLEASFDRLDAKLDLLIELSAKIDWTKYRKTQLEQDNSDD